MHNQIDVARIAEDAAYRDELRLRAQTDLFWLTKYVLGYTKVSERWHRQVADVFIKKDPSRPIEDQHRKHKRMVLLPRKTYKTTFNITDTVQWIIAFPEVAVMAMTASNSPDSPLADAFVAEVASHFYCPAGMPQTILHQLFPEHVITKLQPAGTFITPARTKYRRDPTLKGVSIEQSLSGWHPDILKSEDVQDNRNSQTAFALRKVRQNFYINLKMMGEHGFLDLTGTRYGPMDLYGDMIQKMDDTWVYLWRPAYIRKPHALKLEDDQLTEDDVILQFPEQLSWKFLRSEKNLDENSFWTQYMNIAEGNFKPTFPMERLEAAKISDDDTPDNGRIYIAWRFEYAECKYAAAAVGAEKAGRMTIMEVVRDTLTPTALARRVISLARKWETHRIQIEETPGARSMEQHIRNQALEDAWRIEIQWAEYLQDPTARSLAIKSAEPHLIAGRLLFSDGIQNAQEVFRQLYHFGMVEDQEIASVISRVAANLPASIAAEGFETSDEEAWQAQLDQDAYNRVYSRGEYAEREPVMEVQEEEWDPPSHDDLSEAMPGLSG
ncbi:MAG TPA: hypothetical protein VFE27_24405 [Acidobacteriaceae bacterium]|jgi:hypothetical protein|nr:hypothetical protein [Acidobacteriaceae bacterium]